MDQLAAYLSKYDQDEQERQQNSGNLIYDKEGAEAKARRDQEKKIQFIKDMIAMTIYFFLGLGALFLLCYAFKHYNNNAPIFSNSERKGPKEIEIVRTRNKYHRKNRSEKFSKFDDEGAYVSNSRDKTHD